MKLPRILRFDGSDAAVFTQAAEAGEWAVSGAFLFAGREIEALPRKERIAFRTGFLGIASFGFATLATVGEAGADERAAALEELAAQLVVRLGAPTRTAALAAAGEEIDFAESLCEGCAPGAILALEREIAPDGAIRERFRTLRPRAGSAARPVGPRAFDIVAEEPDVECEGKR